MPSNDQPEWPSEDADVSAEEKPADGGATAQLPVPGEASLPESPTLFVPAPKPDAERTQVIDLRQEQETEPHQLPKPEPRPAQPQQPGPGPQPAARGEQSPGRPEQGAPPERPRPQPAPNPEAPQPAPHPDRPQGEQSQLGQPAAPNAERPQGPQPVPPAAAPLMQPMRIEPSGEIHPAEATTGEEKPPAEPAAKPKRRRKRVLITSALALLLVIAVGAALATPYVSNRLGLPWAPNLPKGDTPEPVPVALSLKAPSESAPQPTSAGVSAALAGPAATSALGTLTGAVIDPQTGELLWDRNSGQFRTPASTTKLLTTSAALLAMDPGTQLSTKVVQGASPDTAVIVAGGDITLSSLPAGQQSVYSGAAHLDDLVTQVKQASGGAIEKVQIDTSIWSGPLTAPGWAPDDAPIYTAAMTPVMLDGGLTDPTNDHSMRVAQPANTVLQTFAQRLGASAAGQAKAPQDAKVLGEVKSAPLSELIAHALEASDNTLADAIGRMTAIATGTEASFAGAAQATLSVLSQNGFDVSQVELSDNSGLSPQNSVPAKLLAQVLAVAAEPDGKDPRTAKLRPMLAGLPVAGGSGTLADRYNAANSRSGKGWVRAKTGTLSGVHTLAGIVLDEDGRVLVFALMSDGPDQDPARAALDVVAASLRGCGCR
ncbi:D-alanyl-D-alanine carboxypeptidase/D-alanyl-D-alanine-endopeptidase [Amycolatopsis thermalba]|uniref:D-alanyl-D-alanine carboxypeptidase/D-alanyl-D-alanine-endopeptidase n=1 Tax=Amycolatopsis thermalba TaxID=944492 RepID=A0ABY4P5S7_9PSEU|nr:MULTISPECIES: D-alanyl-D-alanine carboxypeptidase/D-alanyl-D-alanine-endopeptidase [Amycolatopsis]UQS27644.1 D-alanyl-D-alanine carboxypeptidase/D-alanyl-D-alanine-endopeptidase [Amycolatopsis thermalba]